MSEPRFEVDDAIILILGAPGRGRTSQGRIEGVTRLEKLLFLLQRETEIGGLLTEDPEFQPHNFGPFSSKVYQAVSTLAAAGLIRDSTSLSSSSEDTWESQELIDSTGLDPYATRNFSLTERGRKYYSALLELLPKKTERRLAEFKDQFADIPLRQLVRYVYEKYPEMTGKSLIRDQVL